MKQHELGSLILRKEADTRPNMIKNSDNKIVSLFVNQPLSLRLQEEAHCSARGFVPGRNFVEKFYLPTLALALRLSKAHALQLASPPTILVALSRLQIHFFMFAVLAASFAPDSLTRFVRALYTDCWSSVIGSNVWFLILRGVLQGCPLSSTLFVICLPTFLHSVASRLESNEIICGCADDLLTVVRTDCSLKFLDLALAYLQRVSGLALNMRKVVFVPLAQEVSDACLATFRAWLCANTPRFDKATIATSLVYLGFNMGTRSAQNKWQPQIDAFRVRSLQLSKFGQTLAYNVFGYNRAVITSLAHTAQLEALPDDFSMELREH